ncbi:MAG: DUF45 domain-containing protein, partial [Paludibacteraceae bacterium]|nr:DUF45 domain-containing protein [Paludibacteraceae bacterium]
MTIISVSDISIEVEWKDIKNIHLTIYPPDARIHVSAPKQMTEEAVRLFIITKLPWIRQRVSQILEQNRQTPREYVSGENHYFKGLRFRLKIIYHNAPAKVEVQANEYIKLFIREGATKERRAEVLKEWYRAEFKTLLPSLILKWEEILGVKANKWEIKQMKTLWGSCNHRTRNIIFGSVNRTVSSYFFTLLPSAGNHAWFPAEFFCLQSYMISYLSPNLMAN